MATNANANGSTAESVSDVPMTRAERLAERIPDDASRIQFDVETDSLRRRYEAIVDGDDLVTEHIEWYQDYNGDWQRSTAINGAHRFEDDVTDGGRVAHAEQSLSEYAADRFLSCLRARLSGRQVPVDDVFDGIEVTVDE